MILLLAACASAPARSPSTTAASPGPTAAPPPAAPASLVLPGERHLARVRQVTFGGENAEACWPFDGSLLIFQSTRDGAGCDQEYLMAPDGSGVRRVSDGTGRTTCGYFLPDGERILYASTHEAGPGCPLQPDTRQGYVWALSDYQLYTARVDGSDRRC